MSSPLGSPKEPSQGCGGSRAFVLGSGPGWIHSFCSDVINLLCEAGERRVYEAFLQSGLYLLMTAAWRTDPHRCLFRPSLPSELPFFLLRKVLWG